MVSVETTVGFFSGLVAGVLLWDIICPSFLTVVSVEPSDNTCVVTVVFIINLYGVIIVGWFILSHIL